MSASPERVMGMGTSCRFVRGYSGSMLFSDRAAAVPRLERSVYRVAGEGALRYLHDVVAQDVAGLAAGGSAIAAVLDAGGRIAAEVRVTVAADGTVLIDADDAARD